MIYREAGDFKTTYQADSQTFPLRLDRLGYYALLAVAFLVIPFVVSDYWATSVLVPFLIYAIAALGLNILVGYGGQVSLGTGGFMAVGWAAKVDPFLDDQPRGTFASRTPHRPNPVSLSLCTLVSVEADGLVVRDAGRWRKASHRRSVLGE